jgi:hypothetical protein
MITNGINTKTTAKYNIGISLFFIDNSAIISAHFNGIFLIAGKGYIVIIPTTLNNK